MAERRQFDGVIVVGAGLAGLSAALAAAPTRVLVLTGAPGSWLFIGLGPRRHGGGPGGG